MYKISIIIDLIRHFLADSDVNNTYAEKNTFTMSDKIGIGRQPIEKCCNSTLAAESC